MHKKALITLGSVLVVIICSATLVAWGTYKLLNLPSIRNGFQSTGTEFSAMIGLREKLLETCGCQNAGVQLMNGDTLNISLINSEYNDLTAAQRSARAYEIASFTKKNYAGDAELTRIVIILVQHKSIGPFYTDRTYSYPFEIAELE